MDGDEWDVAAGDTIFIPAGVVHGSLNTGHEPVEVRAVFRSVRYDLATGDLEVLNDHPT